MSKKHAEEKKVKKNLDCLKTILSSTRVLFFAKDRNQNDWNLVQNTKTIKTHIEELEI